MKPIAPCVLWTVDMTLLADATDTKPLGHEGRSDTPTTSANCAEALASARVKARVMGVASDLTTTVMARLVVFSCVEYAYELGFSASIWGSFLLERRTPCMRSPPQHNKHRSM
jgi:hypothetical protein